MKIDLVLRDRDGDVWMYIGRGAYACAKDMLDVDAEYAARHSYPREQIEEQYGPVAVEFREEWHK